MAGTRLPTSREFREKLLKGDTETHGLMSGFPRPPLDTSHKLVYAQYRHARAINKSRNIPKVLKLCSEVCRLREAGIVVPGTLQKEYNDGKRNMLLLSQRVKYLETRYQNERIQYIRDMTVWIYDCRRFAMTELTEFERADSILEYLKVVEDDLWGA